MLAAGSTIGGRYRLTSLIGEGGMANVWRAEDSTLKRAVAIKLLFLGAQRDPNAGVQQFLREARIAAAVQHRNVIHTVDFGTSEEGVPYMVMELLQGENLADRMDRSPRLTIEEMVRLTELTLRGLSAVHEAGIVHRDLKPQNIFLQVDADTIYPKILDFGISRSLGAANDLVSPVLTQQGLVVGTPHYMAPEQARGEAQIDKRADIYSMGAILYEGLTGQMPFHAPTPGELLVKIIATEPPRLRELRPEVPELIADCVEQAMARDREHRFIDAKAFRRALQSAADSAFAQQRTQRASELPVPLPMIADRGVRAAANEQVHAASAQPVRIAAASAHAWGDFEGLDVRAERAAPETPRAAANQPAVAPTNAEPGVRVSQPRAAAQAAAKPQARMSSPRTSTAGTRDGDFAQEGVMLGDNPLDMFAGANAAALELDVGRASSPRVSRVSRASPAPSKRSPPVAHAGYADRGIGRVKYRPSALWLVPGLLLVVLCVLLIAPGLVSEPPPDDAAAQAREAENPATRGSSRTLQKPRTADLRRMSPAWRELLD